MEWVYLAGAILTETAAALSLKAATNGRRVWYATVVAGYLSAFGFLVLTLGEGLGIGIAYGIWAAAGVAITAVASKFLFKEHFTRLMALGIGLISAGVLLVELGSH